MSREKCDYIVVGAGIAGITLALQLDAIGKSIVIYTGTEPNVSSQIAAGLYNPITGRKMVKTWRADDLFCYLEPFYERVEQTTNGSFLHKKTIYRPFISAEEQNEWMGKSAEEDFNKYVKKVHSRSSHEDVNDVFGGIAISHCGFLDIPTYIKSALTYLKKKQSVRAENFITEQLIVKSNEVHYSNLVGNKVIFCEGIGISKNPFFNWLPIRPVKGEIIFIKSDLDIDYILNRGVFILPIGGALFKVGSTYDHHDLTLAPTEKARAQILHKLNEIIKAPFEIVDQIAGIRPATKDRRPFIGLHPNFETIGVFNGLGAKGVSLAPYWSRHFVNHLESGDKLDIDVNITRYFSLYSELYEGIE